jgi:hypothetical protein
VRRPTHYELDKAVSRMRERTLLHPRSWLPNLGSPSRQESAPSAIERLPHHDEEYHEGARADQRFAIGCVEHFSGATRTERVPQFLAGDSILEPSPRAYRVPENDQNVALREGMATNGKVHLGECQMTTPSKTVDYFRCRGNRRGT